MNLQVSASPHIRDSANTQRLMRDVLIALIPALLVSIYMFGHHALIRIAVTVASAVLFEYISRKLMKRENTLRDYSAVLTGLLLAFNLPPSLPVWMSIIGSFIAIVIVKQMFGGLGNNFMNPALAARVVLAISYPSAMVGWAVLGRRAQEAGVITSSSDSLDLVSAATPLALLEQAGGQPTADMPGYLQLFLGQHAGSIGEISIAALLIGIIYLLIRKVITLWTPLSFIATMALLVVLSGQDPLYHLLSGGLVLGAFFMATDYVTSPLTRSGKVIFGIGCGLITALIRLFSGMPEGVSFAILFMNLLTPHIENLTIPVPFGGSRK